MAKDGKNMYRIGDYSRYMGVSTDLLKHYERCGLIHAKTAENGYRYYPFYESTRLLECMRLRNYGFSLGEIQTLLCELPYDKVQAQMDTRIEEVEKQIRFQQMVVAEHKKVSRWMNLMRERELCAVTEDTETMLFLPQSRCTEFADDPRVAQLLEAWVAAMPMAKSCRLFPNIHAENPEEQAMWGLAVSQSDAQALDLPVNDAVIRVEGGQQLHLNIHHTLFHNQNATHYLPGVLETLRGYGVKPKKPVLQFVIMTLECGEKSHENCCWFSASLE